MVVVFILCRGIKHIGFLESGFQTNHWAGMKSGPFLSVDSQQFAPPGNSALNAHQLTGTTDLSPGLQMDSFHFWKLYDVTG